MAESNPKKKPTRPRKDNLASGDMSDTQIFLSNQLSALSTAHGNTQLQLGTVQQAHNKLAADQEKSQALLKQEFGFVKEQMTGISAQLQAVTTGLAEVATGLTKVEQLEEGQKKMTSEIDTLGHQVVEIEKTMAVDKTATHGRIKGIHKTQADDYSRLEDSIGRSNSEISKKLDLLAPTIDTANKIKWGIAGLIVILTIISLCVGIVKVLQNRDGIKRPIVQHIDSATGMPKKVDTGYIPE